MEGRDGRTSLGWTSEGHTYSIAQRVDLNWGDGNVQLAGWGGGTRWGTGGGWLDEEAENLLDGGKD